MPKVVHVGIMHQPDDARIFVKECVSLAQAGYDVTYIATDAQQETVQGVRLLALPPVRGRFRRIILSAWQAYRAALRERAQLYHLHNPELIPAGLLLKFAGKRIVYDAHEDLPGQVLSKEWIPPALRRAVSLLCGAALWLAARLFDGIVVARPALLSRFPSRKTVVVENFPRLEELTLAEGIPYPERPAESFYVGGISVPRGALEMVAAMGLLPEALAAALTLAGPCESDALLESMKRTPGWERVEFVGWLNREQIAQVLGRARLGLVPLYPIPNYLGDGHPTKLMEYMAAGLPVIVTDLPLLRALVEEIDCGLVVPPRDAAALAQAIQWLLEHPEEAEAMGRRGQQAVRERYNWHVEKNKLLELYARWL